MDSLRLVVLADSTAASVPEVSLRINGRPLAGLVAPQLDAGEWYGPPLRALKPPSSHLLGGPDGWYSPGPTDHQERRGKVAVLCCSCGFPDCDALLVRITVLPEHVLWDRFELKTRPRAEWPNLQLRFERKAYETEVARLGAVGVE